MRSLFADNRVVVGFLFFLLLFFMSQTEAIGFGFMSEITENIGEEKGFVVAALLIISFLAIFYRLFLKVLLFIYVFLLFSETFSSVFLVVFGIFSIFCYWLEVELCNSRNKTKGIYGRVGDDKVDIFYKISLFGAPLLILVL